MAVRILVLALISVLVLGGLLTPRAGDTVWRAAFVAGLVLRALAYVSTADVPVRVLAPLPAVLAGGLLPVFAFVAAMLAGMSLHARIGRP